MRSGSAFFGLQPLLLSIYCSNEGKYIECLDMLSVAWSVLQHLMQPFAATFPLRFINGSTRGNYHDSIEGVFFFL